MEDQLAALREEISKLSSDVADRAAGAASTVRDQARDVGQVARAYPVAMSSASLSGVLVGLIIGLILGHSSSPRPWYDYRR